MATFSVGSFATGGSYAFGGFGFTPNVAGPDGSGSAGGANSVSLQQVILGYPSSVTSIRPAICWVYSAIIEDPDDVGGSTNLVATSTGVLDGSEFGTGSYSRLFTFNDDQLDPTKTYYAYFDETPPTCIKTGHPYTGGDAYDDYLEVITNCSPQFKVVMST